MYCSRESQASTRLSQQYEKSTSNNQHIIIFLLGTLYNMALLMLLG